MDIIKKLKIRNPDGSFTDYIPIGSEAKYIETSDGSDVQTRLDSFNKDKIKCYTSIKKMKEDRNLKAGDAVQTLGYYEANDGGNGLYYIKNDEELVDDGGSIHELNNGLKAELIIENKSLNVKQFGAKGDNQTDDYDAFNSLFKYFFNHKVWDSWLASNRVPQFSIEIPYGLYRIKQANLLKNCDAETRVTGWVINGNGSRLIFQDFSGDCFDLHDGPMGITFKDLFFISSTEDGNSERRILFNNYGTGGTQNLCWYRGGFSGRYRWVFNLTGANCNSEYLFDYCNIGGDWESFLHVGATKTSDQFVNYWFRNCKYWSYSPWIDMQYGGHIHLYSCDISGYAPSRETYLFKLGRLDGNTAYGVSSFVDINSRYELKTEEAKVIKCNWSQGQIAFNECDFSSSSHIHPAACKVFAFGDNVGNVKFEHCKLLGKILFYDGIGSTYNKSHTIHCNYCTLYGLIAGAEFQYEVEYEMRGVNWYKFAPTVSFVECNSDNDYANFITTTNLGILSAGNNTNFHNSSIKFTSEDAYIYKWETQKINVPTLIKKVYLCPTPLTVGYTYTIQIVSSLATVISLVSSNSTQKIITVSQEEWSRFRLNTTVIVNKVKCIVSSADYATKHITLKHDENSDFTISENDKVILLLAEANWRANQGTKIIESEQSNIVYDDIYCIQSTNDPSNPEGCFCTCFLDMIS